MGEIHCHKLVYATAVEMAGEMFGDLAKDNAWFADWKRCHPGLNLEQLQLRFAKVMAPKLIPQARHTLAKMLGTNISDHLKEEISQALIHDRTLTRGRAHRRPLFRP